MERRQMVTFFTCSKFRSMASSTAPGHQLFILNLNITQNATLKYSMLSESRIKLDVGYAITEGMQSIEGSVALSKTTIIN